MLNACQELVQLIQGQGRKWQRAVQSERDARVRMERMCEQVASQSAKLEKQIQRASRKDKTVAKSPDPRTPNEDSCSSDSDEFHDAESVFRIPYVLYVSLMRINSILFCLDFNIHQLMKKNQVKLSMVMLARAMTTTSMMMTMMKVNLKNVKKRNYLS